ncbi:hypothetical protein RH915_08075 [Serpentinicella sp. ANB-PHB4]|uniref:hypothetical protein n=1 Tax=Serpentinicella sp. ANB-PHB4 TaxID=3074076 RepID=UPI0028639619|nr:hypothetical protein [Serpentinicella sp. ANB-PHB4]MDR5659446.1 hypothetical protein [Serpentinicella sp. ANB-PHB4]
MSKRNKVKSIARLRQKKEKNNAFEDQRSAEFMNIYMNMVDLSEDEATYEDELWNSWFF